MAYKGKYFEITNFGGGYAGNLPDTQLGVNQASDLDNIVIKEGGAGFRSRLGNQKLHLPYATIQDLTYTAVTPGQTGSLVGVTYTPGGTAGSEIVSVSGNGIQIQIESGVSTATQVKTKFDLSAAATALATCTVSGTGGTAQTAPVVATQLSNYTGLNSAANVQGVGYYLQTDADDWALAVVGNKLYQCTSSSGGAWTDISGAITITGGANNHWDIFTFNNEALGFGGSVTAPDAPWKWTGAGNAAALGGSSPSAYGAFAANNRVFAYRTSTNPSTMYWSIIGDADDFSGTGSGSATIGSLSDNQKVTGAVVLNTNYVLVFKENSTYQMVISTSPFPVYSLFDNVGAAGKKAIVNVDGVVYFITSDGEMKSTDGENVQSYPGHADDLWGAVTPSRYPYIVGFRERGSDYDWLVWCVTTTGSTNNKAIVWDLNNKCWLQNTTGYKFNCASQDIYGNLFCGTYTGFICRPAMTATYGDSSESTATITSYWQSGWMNPDSLDKVTQVRKFTAVLTPKASGSVTLAYGFDGTANSASTTLSQVATASEVYLQKGAMLSGRGNTFEYKVSLASSAIDMDVQRILLSGKVYGQKGQAQD